MEGVLMFVSVIMIVFGILQIILFFKMWGMTNDVKSIRNKVVGSNCNIPAKETFTCDTRIYSNIAIGELVIYKKTNQKFVVKKKVSNDLFECSSLDDKEHYILNISDLRESN